MAGRVIEKLTRLLPGEHHLLFTEIDGRFPNHHPDPTVEANLADLKKLVAEKKLDFGVAFDGDGDRIGAIDGQGRIWSPGAFGREAIYDYGGGTASGRPLRAVQVGGPLGAYFPEALLDTPLDYEAFAERKGLLGHGGIVVFDDTVDLARQARFAMEFCAIESCGKCTPCRIGSTRGMEAMDKIIANQQRAKNLQIVEDLCELLQDGSLCALGGLTPIPVLSALHHFPEDFHGV